jgi:TPR repeat protein
MNQNRLFGPKWLAPILFTGLSLALTFGILSLEGCELQNPIIPIQLDSSENSIDGPKDGVSNPTVKEQQREKERKEPEETYLTLAGKPILGSPPLFRNKADSFQSQQSTVTEGEDEHRSVNNSPSYFPQPSQSIEQDKALQATQYIASQKREEHQKKYLELPIDIYLRNEIIQLLAAKEVLTIDKDIVDDEDLIFVTLSEDDRLSVYISQQQSDNTNDTSFISFLGKIDDLRKAIIQTVAKLGIAVSAYSHIQIIASNEFEESYKVYIGPTDQHSSYKNRKGQILIEFKAKEYRALLNANQGRGKIEDDFLEKDDDWDDELEHIQKEQDDELEEQLLDRIFKISTGQEIKFYKKGDTWKAYVNEENNRNTKVSLHVRIASDVSLRDLLDASVKGEDINKYLLIGRDKDEQAHVFVGRISHGLLGGGKEKGSDIKKEPSQQQGKKRVREEAKQPLPTQLATNLGQPNNKEKSVGSSSSSKKPRIGSSTSNQTSVPAQKQIGTATTTIPTSRGTGKRKEVESQDGSQGSGETKRQVKRRPDNSAGVKEEEGEEEEEEQSQGHKLLEKLKGFESILSIPSPKADQVLETLRGAELSELTTRYGKGEAKAKEQYKLAQYRFAQARQFYRQFNDNKNSNPSIDSLRESYRHLCDAINLYLEASVNSGRVLSRPKAWTHIDLFIRKKDKFIGLRNNILKQHIIKVEELKMRIEEKLTDLQKVMQRQKSKENGGLIVQLKKEIGDLESSLRKKEYKLHQVQSENDKSNDILKEVSLNVNPYKGGIEKLNRLYHTSIRSAFGKDSKYTLKDFFNAAAESLKERLTFLRISDATFMKLDPSKGHTLVLWDATPETKLLPNAHEIAGPLFVSHKMKDYEDAVMTIDTSSTGTDETAYCVAKRIGDYYFILAVGGMQGGYVKDPEGHSDQVARDLIAIARKYNVRTVVVEYNNEKGFLNTLQRNWERQVYASSDKNIADLNFIPIPVDKNKEARIINNFRVSLKTHRLIFDLDVLESDLSSLPPDDLDYKFFYQLMAIKRQTDTDLPTPTNNAVVNNHKQGYFGTRKLTHDDRVDAVATAIQYLKASKYQMETNAVLLKGADKLIEKLQEKKSLVDTETQRILHVAELYLKGDTRRIEGINRTIVKRNYDKARQLYEAYITYLETKRLPVSEQAYFDLAEIYFHGWGHTKQDLSKAEELYQKASEKGKIEAQYKLIKYKYKKYTAKGPDKRADFLREILTSYESLKGFRGAELEYSLFKIYNELYRINSESRKESDRPAAVLLKDKVQEQFTKAIEQGSPQAQYRRGVFYKKRGEDDSNLTKAIEWLDLSAKQGYVKAQVLLGKLYYEIGVHQNLPLAFEWVYKAASKGNIESQCILADMYRKGHGFDLEKQHFDLAFNWYNTATKQESKDNASVKEFQAYAYYKLGKMYQKGRGMKVTKRDSSLASQCYENAHRLARYPKAQFKLAELLESENKIEEAKIFYRRAASKKHPRAQERYRSIQLEEQNIALQSEIKALKEENKRLARP